MKLNLRPLLLLIALVLIFSVGMASLLNYFKFQSTVKKLQRDRIELIAIEVQKAVERSSALGTELASSTTIQALLERQLKSDTLVTLIDIFDDNGKILFSTDKARINTSTPSTWTAAAYRLKKNDWFVVEKSALVTGLVLKNSFDLTIGSVAVRYDRKQFDQTVTAMGMYIGKIGMASAVIAFMLCGLFFVLLSLMMRNDIAKAEHMLNENNTGIKAITPIQREIQALQQSALAAKAELLAIDESLLNLT